MNKGTIRYKPNGVTGNVREVTMTATHQVETDEDGDYTYLRAIDRAAPEQDRRTAPRTYIREEIRVRTITVMDVRLETTEAGKPETEESK